jgi:hypothetical protein
MIAWWVSLPWSPVRAAVRSLRRRHQRLAKPTPGPWVVDDFCMQDDNMLRVGTTDGSPTYYHRTKTICECWTRDPEDEGDDDPHILQAEANARLIAAAPDMLSALKRALNWLASYPGGNAQGAYMDAVNALKKAGRYDD